MEGIASLSISRRICSDIGSAFRKPYCKLSVSPKVESVLDEEVLCILQQFIRDGDIESLLESIQPYCIDRDFSSSRGYLYSIDVLSSTDTRVPKCLGRS